jgi:pimeloyl-ACP methyl ester carboxylesterase
MRAVLVGLFYDEKWHHDEAYLDRRQASGTLPGHWECVAAARFKMPGRPSSGFQTAPWENIVTPALIITGGNDKVVGEPNGGIDNVKGIRTATFEVFEASGHCSHIEHPFRFHERTFQYLKAKELALASASPG